MKNKECLNCKTEIIGNFCYNCGQKSSVHRYNIKHLFTHDLLHGIYHVDKGFLFTIKELFVRPGHAIREHIEGNRTSLFHGISMMIILIACINFVDSFAVIKEFDLVDQENVKYMKAVHTIYEKYPRLFILLQIPFYAIISYFSFRKSKQNYAENLVFTTYLYCFILICNLLFSTLLTFPISKNILIQLSKIQVYFILFYNMIFLYQFFSVFYNKKGIVVVKAIAIPFISVIVIQFILSLVTLFLSKFSMI
jgi:hypothetical protein